MNNCNALFTQMFHLNAKILELITQLLVLLILIMHDRPLHGHCYIYKALLHCSRSNVHQ